MEKLKPCPFCGGEVVCEKHDESYGNEPFRIGCDNENCSAWPSVWRGSRYKAIKAWNTRKETPDD